MQHSLILSQEVNTVSKGFCVADEWHFKVASNLTHIQNKLSGLQDYTNQLTLLPPFLTFTFEFEAGVDASGR